MRRLVVLLVACGRLNFDETACPTDAAPTVRGATYYVGLAGSDSAAGTIDAPWATFAFAFDTMQPGDQLLILDGLYTEPLTPMRSGLPDAPFTIRAAHDGAVVIDGEGMRFPCVVQGMAGSPITDYVIEGVSCRNAPATAAGGDAPIILFYAERITVRRVTAVNGDEAMIEVAAARDVVIEDCAAWGYGSTPIQVGYSDHVTIRRCWVEWSAGPDPDYGSAIALGDTSDSLVENCFVTATAAPRAALTGIAIYSVVMPADRNRVIGNVALGIAQEAFALAAKMMPITSNQFVDNVSIGGGYSFFIRADVALAIKRSTAVDCMSCIAMSPETTDMASATQSSVIVRSAVAFDSSTSPLVLAFDHHHNVLSDVVTPYRNTMAGPGEVMLDPGYDTARYGKGAYLIRPPALATLGDGGPAGAEILYRSVDGVVSRTPLWPWPMNARILGERGVDVTASIWDELPPTACGP